MYTWNSRLNCFEPYKQEYETIKVLEKDIVDGNEIEKEVEKLVEKKYEGTLYSVEQVQSMLLLVKNGKVLKDVNGVPKVCDLYTAEQKKQIENAKKVVELKEWFNNDYRTYVEMFTRRNALDITDVIRDAKRNKTYTSLNELYKEAEVVAKEIRGLENARN